MAYILGLNFAYHESSAALLKDGRLVVAIEEERLNRIKHGKAARIDNPNVLPYLSIDYCLKHAGIGGEDIACVATSIVPHKRLESMVGLGLPWVVPEGWRTLEGETLFNDKLMEAPALVSGHLKRKAIPFHWVEHHVAHAASTFLVSPYDEAAVIVIDGIGELASTTVFHGSGHEMRPLKTVNFPHSIGFVWEKMSEFLGFSEFDGAKVMGLSSYGDAGPFTAAFDKMIRLEPDGGFAVDNDIIRFGAPDFSALEALFGTAKLPNPEFITVVHENIAAALQAKTNQVMLHLAGYAAMVTKSKNLCLAGGVALNCVANAAIMNSGLFESVYVQPASNDAGTALGAASHIYCKQMRDGIPRRFVMDRCYTAAPYSDADVEQELIKHGVKYERVAGIEERVAKLLAEGTNIIGWFQGAMEFGPRALGNRTLLADPRNPAMKEILNLRIKKREPFRPFAPSVLAEDAAEWFHMPSGCSSISTDFMIVTFDVRPEKAPLIPAVVHVDMTSRIQTVRAKVNPRYHRLIAEFKWLTDVPMVLNTSFNDNEPIVSSPYDAIRTCQSPASLGSTLLMS